MLVFQGKLIYNFFVDSFHPHTNLSFILLEPKYSVTQLFFFMAVAFLKLKFSLSAKKYKRKNSYNIDIVESPMFTLHL